MPNDVFISYCQPDKNEARYIHDLLQANGLVSWIAISGSNGVRSGKPYEGQLVDAIQGSRVFLLVYSNYCNESTEVIKEVRNRVSGQATMIVRLDSSAFSGDLSYHLKGLPCINAGRDRFMATINEILPEVQQLIRSKAAPKAAGSTDRLLFASGLQRLEQKDYAGAAGILRQHLSIAPENAETRWYLALALIAGRKTRRLDKLQVMRLEELLLPAVNYGKGGDKYVNVLLAVVKFGYYCSNGFKVPSPSLEQLMTGVALGEDKAEQLLTHLNEPDNKIWQMVWQTFAR